MEANRRICLPFASIYLLHKEQVELHLPTEFDGLHLSAMPAAEGDVVIIDVPVATLYLPKQSALRALGGAENRIWPDVIGQYREQQRILSVSTEQIEIAHQVKTEQQVTLFPGHRPCRVSFAFLELMPIADIRIVPDSVPALEVLDTGDGHFKLLLRVRQLIGCCPCHPHRAEAQKRQQSNPHPFHPSCSRC